MQKRLFEISESVRLSLAFICGTVWLISSPAQAQFLELNESPISDQNRIIPGDFLIPNEPRPANALPILQQAQEGLLAAVGTERVLFDAILAPKITHVLAMDYDPEVIRFHKINSLLIRSVAFGDREAYKKLRYSTQSWAESFANALKEKRISQSDFNFAMDPATSAWWQKNISQNPAWQQINQPKDSMYEGVIYWNEDQAFHRVQELITSGKFQAHAIDLAYATQVAELTAAIRKSNINLSVFDLSNAWQNEFPNNYLGARTNDLVESLSKVAGDESILMLTRGSARPYPTAPNDIAYFGYHFGFIKAKSMEIDSWSKKPFGWERFYQMFEWETRPENWKPVAKRAAFTKFSKPILLPTSSDLESTLAEFPATILFLGHGSKGQFKDPQKVLEQVDETIRRLNSQYGEGKWVAVFGGDNFHPEKPDIALVMKYLKEARKVPVLAVQSDVVIPWGGVDKYIDYVHYIPTEYVPELDKDGKHVVADGKPKQKVVWGGFIDGKPAGPTGVYLGPQFLKGILKGVVAVGGGPIAAEEAKYAHDHGIPVEYIRAETKFPEVNGQYGSVDTWAASQLPGGDSLSSLDRCGKYLGIIGTMK